MTLRLSRIALLLGLAGILTCELLLFANVFHFTRPHTRLDHATLFIRGNMTPLCWLFYILFLVGVLSKIDRTSFLARFRNRFFLCWLWSVTAWCYFDFMNFYFMRGPHGFRAWEYINLPPYFSDRLVGYLIAFGAIAPGMFLSAELFMRLGFKKLTTRRHMPLSKRILITISLISLPVALMPILVGGPACNFALWIGIIFLLDPLNALYGRPSILLDWHAGRFGRTLALAAGGLWCGLLWEFWNYWAFTKWVYHLPFLGPLEHYRYFEMPLPGLLGFIPFGVETWVMWQFSLIALAPFVEGERKTPADNLINESLCS